MKADATNQTPTRGNVPNELSGVGQLGASLFEIGWQLAGSIILPLWLISIYKSSWLKSSWFALFIIWVVIVFALIVRRQIENLPKAYGGKK